MNKNVALTVAGIVAALAVGIEAGQLVDSDKKGVDVEAVVFPTKVVNEDAGTVRARVSTARFFRNGPKDTLVEACFDARCTQGHVATLDGTWTAADKLVPAAAVIKAWVGSRSVTMADSGVEQGAALAVSICNGVGTCVTPTLGPDTDKALQAAWLEADTLVGD